MTGNRQRAAVGYYASSDVLTPELTAAALEALGAGRKVTFGEGGAAFTKSENLLPEDLVWRIRDHLDRYELTCRTVFVSKYSQREVPRHVAFTLAKFMLSHGSTLAAAADAVGYHVNSLACWGLRRDDKTIPEFHGSAEDVARYLEVGRAHCASLGAREREATAHHFVWVGWGRGWVASLLERVRGAAVETAAVGGPASAFATVFQVPPVAVERLAKWSLPRDAQPFPPGLSDEERLRLHEVGRSYCWGYSKPLPTRHYAWVGWLIERARPWMELAPSLSARELKG